MLLLDRIQFHSENITFTYRVRVQFFRIVGRSIILLIAFDIKYVNYASVFITIQLDKFFRNFLWLLACGSGRFILVLIFLLLLHLIVYLIDKSQFMGALLAVFDSFFPWYYLSAVPISPYTWCVGWFVYAKILHCRFINFFFLFVLRNFLVLFTRSISTLFLSAEWLEWLIALSS